MRMQELLIFITIIAPWTVCLYVGFVWGENNILKKYFKRENK